MQKVKQSTENEMVYEFLKMEMNSDRYKKKIEKILLKMNVNKSTIFNGNLMSKQENALRSKVLREFRGYRDKEIFENFPTKIDWIWSVFDQEDITKIRYIEYSYWNELSNYTGSPLEAAKTIHSKKTVFNVSNDGFLKGAQNIKEGKKFPPLIFLTDESLSRYIILEGHLRMTAYGLVPDLFKNVSVLLGYCSFEELNKWYGQIPVRT